MHEVSFYIFLRQALLPTLWLIRVNYFPVASISFVGKDVEFDPFRA